MKKYYANSNSPKQSKRVATTERKYKKLSAEEKLIVAIRTLVSVYGEESDSRSLVKTLQLLMAEFNERVAGFFDLSYRCQKAMWDDGSLLELELGVVDDNEVREMSTLLDIPSLIQVPFDELDEDSDFPERGEVYKVRFFKMADGSLHPRTPYLLREADDSDLTL